MLAPIALLLAGAGAEAAPARKDGAMQPRQDSKDNNSLELMASSASAAPVVCNPALIRPPLNYMQNVNESDYTPKCYEAWKIQLISGIKEL